LRIDNKSNTIILENETIRKVADFTYLGSRPNVSEGGGAVKDVNIRILKVREPSPGSGKYGNQLAFISTQKITYLTHV
jgi:hypothetical protein